MKCPQCGQWNRASFPRCVKCGAELPAETAAEIKQNAPQMPEGGAAKVYAITACCSMEETDYSE